MAERSQTKMIVLMVVLAILFVAVVLFWSGRLPGGSGKGAAFNGPSPNDQAGQVTPEANDSTPAAQVGVRPAWKRPDPVGPIARDPMRMEVPKTPPTAGTAEGEPNTTPRPADQPRFAVTGIIFSTEQPSSIIIDGRILHEGDTIYGATVARIAEQYAELTRGDKKWTIKPGQANQEP